MVDTTFEIQTTKNDLIRVNPLGAKIEVVLNGNAILGSFLRGDGRQGVTHPCSPIFGPDRKNFYGLKQHGNMRNEACEVEKKDDSIVVSHLITDPGYPSGMKVEQVMRLIDGAFSFEMTHTNTGDMVAAVNSGEHCYFDAPLGFEGTKVNGQDITQLIKNNYDGIAIDLNESNSIQIPGKPEYILEQQGFKKAVVWVGKNPETKEIDKTYLCIEPVEDDPFGEFFGTTPSLVIPGKNRRAMFNLQVR